MGSRIKARKKTKTTNFFTNRKSKSSSRLALIAIGVLILTISLGKFVSFLNVLRTPFSEDLLVKKQYTWDDKTSINIAFKYKGISVLHYDPSDKKIVVLKIPDDAYLELPKGFGYWKVGSIYTLGQEESRPVGSELVKQSMAKLLGIPIDGFISINRDSDQSLDSLILSLHNHPLKTLSFVKDIETDFTPLETFSLIGAISGARADNVALLDLAQSNITSSELLPDSSRVLGIDSVRMDLFIRDKMADSQISNEQVPIAIFNATAHPGLAADAAREVTNLGGNVIFVSNTEKTIQKSIVTSTTPGLTTNRLTELFAPSCAKSACKSDDYHVNSSRAEINIVIGEDFYNDHYLRN